LALESKSIESDRKQQKASATRRIQLSESINEQQRQIQIPLSDVGFKDTLVVWFKTLSDVHHWWEVLVMTELRKYWKRPKETIEMKSCGCPSETNIYFYCWYCWNPCVWYCAGQLFFWKSLYYTERLCLTRWSGKMLFLFWARPNFFWHLCVCLVRLCVWSTSGPSFFGMRKGLKNRVDFVTGTRKNYWCSNLYKFFPLKRMLFYPRAFWYNCNSRYHLVLANQWDYLFWFAFVWRKMKSKVEAYTRRVTYKYRYGPFNSNQDQQYVQPPRFESIKEYIHRMNPWWRHQQLYLSNIIRFFTKSISLGWFDINGLWSNWKKLAFSEAAVEGGDPARVDYDCCFCSIYLW